jgi:hypothetical protein
MSRLQLAVFVSGWLVLAAGTHAQPRSFDSALTLSVSQDERLAQDRPYTVRPRNGPVVTAGGLVFLPNSQDRTLRAYDTSTGAVVWERELDANPEGIPAVYEVRGRQYIAFAAGASWGTGVDPVWKNPFHRKAGKIDAQGYHVFALPVARPAQGRDR